MPVTRMNHAVLYVRDADRTAQFYQDALGFSRVDMGLEELERLARALADRGALTGASDHGTTKALYAKDPDGLEFEVSWLVPAALLDDEARARQATIGPLDIAADKARYGATTRGGLGVSVPA